MNKVHNLFILAICAPLMIQGVSSKFRIDMDLEDSLDVAFEKSRQLLSSDEREFLEEILATDDAILERQKRGIVDQILAAIAGVAPGVQVIGPSVTVAPTNAVVSPTVAPTTAAPKSDLNNTKTTDCGTPCTVSKEAVPAPAVAPAPAPTVQETNNNANNDNHLFAQISKVIVNSATRNVTGIVDEALKIGTPAPVRDLVNGILGVAYCNSIRRLLGRC